MKYKCLHIITRLANGGAEETVFDLIVQLATHGIYCDLAVGKESEPEVLQKYTLPQECSIHTIPHLVRNPRPVSEILAIREIRQLIAREQYNIVQTHGSKAGVLGRIAAHKEKVPVIIGMIHGISFPPAMNILSRMLYKSLERYVARLSDSLVCVGEDMKKKYLEAKIGKPAQYKVIYTGMQLQQFTDIANSEDREALRIESCKKFNLPNDRVIIGSIGRLENRKNQKALIHMMPKLIKQYPKLHLCLIGDGPNYDILQTLIKNLHVSDHVSLLGYVPKVWEVLPALDIHAMVSLWEGLPRVLVQTAAAGLPNICYEVDGAWEIIQDNSSGYIISRDNESEYIEKLLLLIEDVTLRKRFGNEATNMADTRWSLENFGNETKLLYRALLNLSQ